MRDPQGHGVGRPRDALLPLQGAASESISKLTCEPGTTACIAAVKRLAKATIDFDCAGVSTTSTSRLNPSVWHDFILPM